MTKGHDEQRVRPIEYSPDASSFPAPHQDESERPGQPRPWIALALSAMAVLLAVGAVTVFGSLEFNDPPLQEPQEFASGAQSELDTPPETLPPRLEDSLPNLTDRLTLVAVVDDTLQTLLWDPSFRVPKAYELPIEGVDAGTDIEATFDSGGRTLAVTVTTPQTTLVYLGDPSDIGRAPDIVGPISVLWHASEVGALSWVLPSSDRQWDLYTGKVDPLTGAITNAAVITQFTTPVGLVRWDSSGFVLNSGSDVVAIGSAGEPEWVSAGVAVSGSASILAVIAPDDSASNTRWVIMDRYSGEAAPQQITGTPSEIWVTTSRDTDLIAEISASTDKTRILVNGPEIAAKRIVQVDLHVAPVGFTSSGEYFQFNMFDSNDLVFVNWRTGATHTVPIPDNTTVIGSDLG